LVSLQCPHDWSFPSGDDRCRRRLCQRDFPRCAGAHAAGLVDDLRDLVYELLPDGFENGDGGQGDLSIDVVPGTVRLDYGKNYTETRSTTREFIL